MTYNATDTAWAEVLKQTGLQLQRLETSKSKLNLQYGIVSDLKRKIYF